MVIESRSETLRPVGDRIPPSDGHSVTSEKGSWIVFKNGKQIDKYDGDWDPHDYEYSKSVNAPAQTQTPNQQQSATNNQPTVIEKKTGK